MVNIRPYRKEDEADIVRICYKTGFMGEDLAASGRFRDVRLFGYLFCLYYLWYEPQTCFVAEEESSGRVVGYLLGTADTVKQRIAFAWKMGLRIVGRLVFYTSWRYPESLAAVVYFISHANKKSLPKGYARLYPAHLHINVLPDSQKTGVGAKLLQRLEAEMRQRAVTGIHLKTSNKNRKAVAFYGKHGYTVIAEREDRFWRGITQYRQIVFAKRLEKEDTP